VDHRLEHVAPTDTSQQQRVLGTPNPPARLNGKETPDYPLGAPFTGRAWSEPTLLRLAYAFERASQARRPPPGSAA
jgi:Asp-tRNA(Asn)/Glu-tRNA(Gln) amidotransferase A subunit family amidase